MLNIRMKKKPHNYAISPLVFALTVGVIVLLLGKDRAWALPLLQSSTSAVPSSFHVSLIYYSFGHIQCKYSGSSQTLF